MFYSWHANFERSIIYILAISINSYKIILLIVVIIKKKINF